MFFRKLFDRISRNLRPSGFAILSVDRLGCNLVGVLLNPALVFLIHVVLFNLTMQTWNHMPQGNSSMGRISLPVCTCHWVRLDHNVLQTVGIAVTVTIVGKEDFIVISVDDDIFVSVRGGQGKAFEKADDEFSVSKVHWQ